MKAFTIALALLLSAASVRAQDKGYVQGIGGATFQARTAGLIGLEAGFDITRDLIVFGETGQMLNVLPRSVQDDLDNLAGTLEPFLGSPVKFDGKIRATYLFGGVKYHLPLRTRVRPYVLGGAGIVSYAGSLRERTLGDVLDQAISLGLVDADDVDGIEAAGELGLGVTIPAGRAQIDAGYRFMNVKGVSVNRIVGGVGIRF
jgi:hypothetical protein